MSSKKARSCRYEEPGPGQAQNTRLQVRTLFDGTPGESACREAWQHDVESAKMSSLFRCYYRMRPWMPLAMRQLLQRRRNRTVPVAANWYLPTAAFSQLSQSLANAACEVIHPWPGGADYGLVLTHDVETAAGMRNISAITAIEDELGFRSSWNLVPYKYPIDYGLLRDLQRQGFEIGVHGYNHDGRLFSSAAAFRKRAIGINRALQEFGSVGFRAPMVHRDLELLQLLEIDYDASCFDIDPFQAMPGGIGSLWPVIVGKLVELPYTLPQDHTLFVSLGHTDTRVWQHKLEFIRQQSGMALMLTHPDYLDSTSRRSLYRDFLTRVRDVGGYWHALPRDVASWWRARAASTIETDPKGARSIMGPAATNGVVAQLGAEQHGLRFQPVVSPSSPASQ